MEYKIESLELLKITTEDKIDIKIFEDGLIILSYENIKEYSLFTDLNNITEYYEKNYHLHLIIYLV